MVKLNYSIAFIPIIFLAILFILTLSGEKKTNEEIELYEIYKELKGGNLSRLSDRPIHVRSSIQNMKQLSDVYTISDIKHNDLRKHLTEPANWCALIIVHPNIKGCVYKSDKMILFVGEKVYQHPENTIQFNYQFQVFENNSNSFIIHLIAKHGPLGTRNHKIVFESFPVKEGSFLHLSVSYEGGYISNSILEIYLATIGRDKVGFTVIKRNNGEAIYVKGLRGLLERNVMRCYLALQSFFDTMNASSEEMHLQRAAAWYGLSEFYQRQLHEIRKDKYLDTKKREHANQLAIQKLYDMGKCSFCQQKNIIN